MTKALQTCVFIPLLLCALLLPKVGGLLLHIHPGIMTMVICTGTELVTIQIGADGEPVEAETTESGPCLLNVADLGEGRTDPAWIALASSYKTPFVVKSNQGTHHNHALINRESQGPPFA